MATATITCPLCKGEGVVPSPDADDFALDMVCPCCGGVDYIDVDLEDED